MSAMPKARSKLSPVAGGSALLGGALPPIRPMPDTQVKAAETREQPRPPVRDSQGAGMLRPAPAGIQVHREPAPIAVRKRGRPRSPYIARAEQLAVGEWIVWEGLDNPKVGHNAVARRRRTTGINLVGYVAATGPYAGKFIIKREADRA
jgi:hypothetical protein